MAPKHSEPRDRASVLIPLDPEEALRALSTFERPRGEATLRREERSAAGRLLRDAVAPNRVA